MQAVFDAMDISKKFCFLRHHIDSTVMPWMAFADSQQPQNNSSDDAKPRNAARHIF
jgi:hypothetical protein